MKKLLVLLLALSLIFVFAACGTDETTTDDSGTEDTGDATADETTGDVVIEEAHFQLAHEQPETHPYHMGAVKFAELVEEYSDGAMTVEVFSNGTLGKASALAESISMGTVDFASVFSIVLESYSDTMGVMTLPYTFSSWDHAFAALDGEIGDELKASMEGTNIKILDFWTNGLAQINSTMPIRTPDDIKGKKFRIQEGPSYAALSEALGSITTPMSFGEVYSALQLGAMDCQLQTINNIYSSKFYEVAPYFTILDMCFNTNPFIMSQATWDGLSEAQRDVIVRASRDAAVYEREYHAQDTEACLEAVAADGGEIIELTEEEQALWHEACEKVYENPNFSHLMDLFNRIQEYK